MSDIKQKIIKLFAQADSEHKIGNTAAAALYRKKASALLRQNKLTKKSLTEPETFNVGGHWRCSCGTEIKLQFKGASRDSVHFVNLMLHVHEQPGHKLMEIK